MTRQIVLHVGTEKTGTTSIQRYLWERRQVLRAQGCLYPESLGPGPHIKITGCCLDFSENAPVLKLLNIRSEIDHSRHKKNTECKIRKEIECINPSLIIFSDEHINIHLSTERSLNKLYELIERIGELYKVILYLRRQDRLLESMMSEAIKNCIFNVYNFENPVNKNYRVGYRFQYDKITNNLKKVFSDKKVVVRGYRSDSEFDILEDFLGQVGMQEDRKSPYLPRQNKSIPERLFLPLARMGALATSQHEADLLSSWRLLVDQAVSTFPGKGFRLRKEDAKVFLEQFTQTNEALCSQYPNLESTFDESPETFHQGVLEDQVTPYEVRDSACDVLPRPALEALNRVCRKLSSIA